MKDWKKDFDDRFPRFGCDDDYCAPTVRTKGKRPQSAFDGEELMCGDEAIRANIKDFIESLLEKKINHYKALIQ